MCSHETHSEVPILIAEMRPTPTHNGSPKQDSLCSGGGFSNSKAAFRALVGQPHLSKERRDDEVTPNCGIDFRVEKMAATTAV